MRPPWTPFIESSTSTPPHLELSSGKMKRMAMFSVLLLFLCARFSSEQGTGPGPPDGVPVEFDCGMRRLGVEFARMVANRGGERSSFSPEWAGHLVGEAMQVERFCGDAATSFTSVQGGATSAAKTAASKKKTTTTTTTTTTTGSRSSDSSTFLHAVYADSVDGNDANDGASGRPVRTLERALEAMRSQRKEQGAKPRRGRIILSGSQVFEQPDRPEGRGGRGTLLLGPEDSNLRIECLGGIGKCSLSGGSSIQLDGLKIERRISSDAQDVMVYSTDLPEWLFPPLLGAGGGSSSSSSDSSSDSDSEAQGSFLSWSSWTRTIMSLRLRGRQMWPARYPNCDPYREEGRECRLPGDREGVRWHAPKQLGEAESIEDASVQQPNHYVFKTYRYGRGGQCSIFDPPESYWCSNATEGGEAFGFRVPGGVDISHALLPNLAALEAATTTAAKRRKPPPVERLLEARINVWRPERWANWVFEARSEHAAGGWDGDGVISLNFTRGGFQGARGGDIGGDWFIEDLESELDQAGEFWLDRSTSRLWLCVNASDAPLTDADSIVIPRLSTILRLDGAKNVELSGIEFLDQRVTVMEPHAVPSGGDWALERLGSLELLHTENVSIRGCTFAFLGGTAVLISSFNRNTTIEGSSFEWLGGSGIVAWGDTKGVDGTGGMQPRGLWIQGNLMREIGKVQKQSSFVMLARSCMSTIRGNIMFNGPRAGVNFNDHFGGANSLSANLIFNVCRESGDHGPFNSWDRIPFLHDLGPDRTPSAIPLTSLIQGNFLVANYQALAAVDTDDGSQLFDVNSNFLVYGFTGQKAFFNGQDLNHTDNLVAYTEYGMSQWSRVWPGHANVFRNNTVVLRGESKEYAVFDKSLCFGNGSSSFDQHPSLGSNTVYTASGNATVCGVTLEEYQEEADVGWNDSGSCSLRTPRDGSEAARIFLDKARLLLGMPPSPDSDEDRVDRSADAQGMVDFDFKRAQSHNIVV